MEEEGADDVPATAAVLAAIPALIPEAEAAGIVTATLSLVVGRR